MEIKDPAEFIKYWHRIRERTLRVVRLIPPDKLEWTFQEGKFTLGDLARHLAAIERDMYAENARFLPSRYKGCSKDLAKGFDNVLRYMETQHREAMEIFGQLSPADMERKTRTPGGAEIRLWKWLRAMVEHEAHHRGQIYLYLSQMGIETPPLYGLTSEEVAERSR